MALKQFNPTSPGRRFMTDARLSDLSKEEAGARAHGAPQEVRGAQLQGRITIWFRAGPQACLPMVDFRRDKRTSPKVAALEYDPTARRGSLSSTTSTARRGTSSLPRGLKVGADRVAGEGADILPGNALPLRMIPAGTMIHNLELRLGKGGQLVRSAGAAASSWRRTAPTPR